MTKVELKKRIRNLSEKEAKAVLEKIVFCAIRDGDRLGMSSSEMFAATIDILKESGLPAL